MVVVVAVGLCVCLSFWQNASCSSHFSVSHNRTSFWDRVPRVLLLFWLLWLLPLPQPARTVAAVGFALAKKTSVLRSKGQQSNNMSPIYPSIDRYSYRYRYRYRISVVNRVIYAYFHYAHTTLSYVVHWPIYYTTPKAYPFVHKSFAPNNAEEDRNRMGKRFIHQK